jgi:hypothetical protein
LVGPFQGGAGHRRLVSRPRRGSRPRRSLVSTCKRLHRTASDSRFGVHTRILPPPRSNLSCAACSTRRSPPAETRIHGFCKARAAPPVCPASGSERGTRRVPRTPPVQGRRTRPASDCASFVAARQSTRRWQGEDASPRASRNRRSCSCEHARLAGPRDCLCPIAVTRRARSGLRSLSLSRAEQARRGSACRSCLWREQRRKCRAGLQGRRVCVVPLSLPQRGSSQKPAA